MGRKRFTPENFIGHLTCPLQTRPDSALGLIGFWERRRHGTQTVTPEDIIGHLRTVEIESGKGVSVPDACRKLGICEQTYYRWKREYGGLRVDQAKRLKGLEQENTRLKKLVADLALDKAILQEVAEGNF